MSKMKSTYQTRTPEETMELGMQLVSRLTPGTVVLLFGDLGSGKTHFVKGIAEGLGIEEMIKSPTFTYVNQYRIEPELQLTESGEMEFAAPLTFFHYDLYRLESGGAFHSIGLEDTLSDPDAINVIEWADRLEGTFPQDYIRIDFQAGEGAHQISIEFRDSQVVPKELVEQYWDVWKTPMHVRDHCRQVANVALQIGQAFVDQQIIVDLDMLFTAALLHDMTRVVDFKTLDRSQFNEEISEKTWVFWVSLREQFAGMHHADVGCAALWEEGFYKTAEIIRMHRSVSIVEEPQQLTGALEIAIVYYADKRVKHNQVVSLAERYKDGRERNSTGDPELESMYEEAYHRQFELERDLFESLAIGPEDIQG